MGICAVPCMGPNPHVWGFLPTCAPLMGRSSAMPGPVPHDRFFHCCIAPDAKKEVGVPWGGDRDWTAEVPAGDRRMTDSLRGCSPGERAWGGERLKPVPSPAQGPDPKRPPRGSRRTWCTVGRIRLVPPFASPFARSAPAKENGRFPAEGPFEWCCPSV